MRTRATLVCLLLLVAPWVITCSNNPYPDSDSILRVRYRVLPSPPKTLDPAVAAARMKVLRLLGVPYSDEDLALAEQRYVSQARLIADDLLGKDVEVEPMSEMVAMIAYLQRLGRGPQPVVPEPVLTAEAGGE